MKNILKNKKKIIIILLVLVIVLIGIVVIKKIVEKEINKKIELGNSIYEKVHNLYFYGGNIEYETNENKTRNYIEIDNTKYYEIKNSEEITNLITEKMIVKTSNFLGIKVIGNKYYMKDYGRGLSGYYGTKLKIKRIARNKIEYKAISTLCQIDSLVNYGEGCSENNYYEIEKPFILIKEEGTWKVEEYTSIFEFNDSELK